LPKRQGSYGIDAPYLLIVPGGFLLWNVINGLMHPRLPPFVAAGALLAALGSGLYTSRRGKFEVWSRLFGSLALRGNERILDLGCGRGAVLLLAARQLTTGYAAAQPWLADVVERAVVRTMLVTATKGPRVVTNE
jgi:hypothetical protein